MSETIEEIVLHHSQRGMTLLRQYMEPGYLERAAKRILSMPRGKVLLTTGFYVAGAAETDGPPGTLCAAKALQQLGFTPVIVTDEICRDLFEPEGIEVAYVPVDADSAVFQKIFDETSPVFLLSIERCGRNLNNDYANMRGVSIAKDTAQVDLLFEIAEKAGVYTIGVGDGGNEIGMGNVQDIITEHLGLVPCTTKVDELLIATTSNWGAFGLVAVLDALSEQALLPDYDELEDYLKKIVEKGCVDGIAKVPQNTVDGFAPEVERELFTLMHEAIAAQKAAV